MTLARANRNRNVIIGIIALILLVAVIGFLGFLTGHGWFFSDGAFRAQGEQVS